jgi:hypothetical protein
MASKHLRTFKHLWSSTCKSMWIELTALYHLTNTIRGEYSLIDKDMPLTGWIYAPQCAGRIEDTVPDLVLNRSEEWMSSIALSRIVLLSSGFEVYFEEFVALYLKNRKKYYTGSSYTQAGNKVRGEVFKTRGLAERIVVFADYTGAKTRLILPDLPTLNDVYRLRNVIAHDAAIPDSRSAIDIKSVKIVENEPLRISVDTLVTQLAPPVIRLAEKLDAKIPVPKKLMPA